MTQAEKLPHSHPAELRIDGGAQYTGIIDAVRGEELCLSQTHQLSDMREGEVLQVHKGARAELCFREIFDDDGDAISVPVTVMEIEGDVLILDFREDASDVAGNLREQLRSSQKPGRQGKNPELLAEFRQRATRQIEKTYGAFLMDATDHLMDLAGRPGQKRDLQDHLYDAMNIFRRNEHVIVEKFTGQIDGMFDEPLAHEKPSAKGNDTEFSELQLVDTQEFEDSLTIERMVREGQRRYGLKMEALTIRFAELAGTEPIETRLPVHVEQICIAFRNSLRGLGLERDVGPDLYRFFQTAVVQKLENYFTSLNVFLKDKGVRPDIDRELERHGSLFDRIQKDKARAAAKPKSKPAPAPAAEPPEGEDSTAPGSEAPQAAFGSAAGTPAAGTPAAGTPAAGAPAAGLHAGGSPGAGAHGTGAPAGGAPAGGTPAGGAPAGGTPAGGAPAGGAPGTGAHTPGTPSAGAAGPSVGRFDAPTLYRSVIDALNFRRTDPRAVEAGVAMPGEPAAGGSGSGGPPADSGVLAAALSAMQLDEGVRSALREQRSVREYLTQHQADLSELEGTDGIEPESVNQIDLVDNLFTDISTDVDVAPDLRPVVGDLQIPLAKLALLEPQFFADKDHPARGVIDKVTQLANSANYPNKALELKVSAIIDNIVQNYRQDSGVFAAALSELDGLSEQQKKALERNVERVVKTQDGQEKLRKAEKAVEKVLASRVRPPKAPKPIVDLVDKGWRDLLKLTFVKQGPNSRAWKDYVKTLDLLSLWLMQKQKGGDSADVQVERALEAETLLDMVSQQISEALPTHVDHEPVLQDLRDVLAGRKELEYVDIEPPAAESEPSPDEIRKKVEQLPRLRRWVRRVEDLERGSWLTYRDKEGARRRMQLAWISENQDRFLFVNERGQKVADLSGVELARMLSRGVKPPTPAEELPLVDQSMYKTLEDVQKSLSFDMHHDSLTRLINRDTFMEQVERALEHAKSKHSTHALLYMDIDKFGIVNDLYDEAVGDQILVDFGQLLAKQHSRKILSARLESDRFAVLLLDRTLEKAIAYAEGLREQIEQHRLEVENDKVSLTVSIGVASILDFSKSVDEIIEHGSAAAEDAKQRGANQVVHYNEDKARAEAYKAEEAAGISKVQETLDTKNFVLQAQPIARTDLVNGKLEVEHYEILLAIRNEQGQLTSPVEFIASAERFGFMTQVDQWVVRQVFAWVSQMMDEQKNIPSLAINLSGNSVTDDAFMEFLFEAISEYGVGTGKICFEITETGTIDNMVKATDFVNEFKNIGCKFSIDDFGTGLASHSYLRDLPVDYVKIDGTFIKNIHENPKDFAMAKSINDLAHFLGQETIAEFAENDEVIAKIREIGVDYIQGWGVGRPAPLADLAEKLEMLEK